MQLLDLTLASLEANLALDEALLLEAEAGTGREVLRFWEWSGSAVVLGSGCKLGEDVDEAACRRQSVPILRRSSGGGTVLLGPGCLCFSLVLGYERSPLLREIKWSYVYILERVAAALTGLGPVLQRAGTSDLATGGQKVSGNAQQRKRAFLLHHGTLLYAFDGALVGHYLRMPARQPDYRQGRPHAAFLANLPANSTELKRRLMETWQAQTALPAWPREPVARLVEEKYEKAEWLRRR